ncbi:MAG: hypothetical protein JNJ73_00400 [Hyphomonadaceae bacterium]|nr:hypothetical protein [Hyphomonadaceae bacterium]
MGDPRHMLLRASARAVTPAILLVALYLALAAPSGGGLQAGGLAALAFVLHAMVHGASATLGAFPAVAQKLAMAIGVALIVGSAFAPPAWRAVGELGLAMSVGAGFTLAFCVIAGRAHELRGGEW